MRTSPFAELHPARRALALLAALGPVGYWARESARASSIASAEFLFLVLAVVALVGLQLSRLGAQVAGRAAALGFFGLGAVGFAATREGEAAFVAGAGLSLLAVGSGPLRSPAALEQFAPIGWRRTFLWASTLQLVGAYALATIGIEWLSGPSEGSRVTPALMIGLAGALALGVAGVLRMRAWGVLLSLASAIGAAVVAGLASFAATRAVLGLRFFDDMGFASIVFGAAAVLPLGMALPVVASWVRPVRTVATEGRLAAS